MRVRFQVGERGYCIARNNFYSFGEIEDHFDDGMARAFIESNIAESFEDSFNDEEIRALYEKFISTEEFEKKVDLFIMVKTKSNKKVKLSDGTELLFELTPTKPEEWYYYNKLLCDFYIKNFYRCRFESFKENFDRKLNNFPHFNELKKHELVRIMDFLNTDNNEGILHWYKAGLEGEIPLDEKGIKDLFSKEIYYGIENYLQGKAIVEYVVYLHKPYIQSKNDKNKPGRTKLFPEYLLNIERKQLAEQLKIEFSTEIGKSIRLMIKVLNEMQLLTIENRGRKSFYNALKKYFNRNIGSYPSIFDYEINPVSDKEDIKTVQTKINFILTNLKGLNKTL